MSTLVDNIEAQRNACLAISNLAYYNVTQVMIAAPRCVDFIIDAMIKFGDDAVLHNYACSALTHIVRDENTAEKTIASGCIENVVKSMVTFSDNADIQG